MPLKMRQKSHESKPKFRLFTALFGVVSFTALSYDIITRAKLILAIGGIVILVVALVYFLYLYNKELDRLEKL